MAVTFSMAAQKKFLIDLFGEGWVTANVDPLLAQGVSLKTGWAELSATYQGYVHTVTFGMNTTEIIKQKPSHLIQLITHFIHDLNKKIDTGTWQGQIASPFDAAKTHDDVMDAVAKASGIPAELLGKGAGGAYTPVGTGGFGAGGGGGGNSGTWDFPSGGSSGAGSSIAPASGGNGASGFTISNKEAYAAAVLAKKAKMVEQGLAAQIKADLEKADSPLDEALGSVDDVYVDAKTGDLKLKPGKKSKPSFPGVVALRDATFLGQPVRGTTEGSFYKTVAIGERVKLAAKIAGTKISFRAECTDATYTERKAMIDVGLSPKADGTYYSCHMDTGDVPKARVFGAFLMGLDINFNEQVKSFKEAL